MSKHHEQEDKRRRLSLLIVGPLAIAALCTVLGFVLGNVTAHSAMGADTSDVVAQTQASCVITPDTALYLATSAQHVTGHVDHIAVDSTGGDRLGGQGDVTPEVDADTFSAPDVIVDAVISVNEDASALTPTPDLIVVPDPIPNTDGDTVAREDRDHEHTDHQEGHEDNEGNRAHSVEC